jgi:choline dehydrogenase-like flavoprotein
VPGANGSPSLRTLRVGLDQLIQDLRNESVDTTIAVDLCIIGGGAAGISIALQFLDSPTTVCIVESGGLDFEPETQALYAGQSLDESVALDVSRLRMFGGTTNHWGGRCAELSAAEFAARDWVPFSGWPIKREELSAYYGRAREICGFAAEWPSDSDTLRTLGATCDAATPDQVDNQIWRFAPDAGAGNWNFALAHGPALRQAPNIRLVLHANCTTFETSDALDHIQSIAVRSLNGKTGKVTARVFVLCCGGIENARLLLAGSPSPSRRLGTSADLVGRFFMDHLRLECARVVPTDALSPMQDTYGEFVEANGIHCQIGLALAEAAQREHKLLNCSAVIDYIGDPHSGLTAAQDIWERLREGRWTDDLGAKVFRVLSDLPAIERNAERRLVDRRHPLLRLDHASITVDVEQAPNPDSRVLLSDDVDPLGMRRVAVDWRFSPLEKSTVRQFILNIAAAFGLHGIGRVMLAQWLDDPGDEWRRHVGGTQHHTGTTRMSAAPTQGVVDPDCRVWGIHNLYVAGSSVFPTNGHVNPTLSIVALAVRLADHLRMELRKSS